jgi:hypothetical protein
MADLTWAAVYKFDEDAGGYTLTTFDEEINPEQSQPGEQMTLSTQDSLSDSDLDDLDDHSS